jgi:hypothetical protein
VRAEHRPRTQRGNALNWPGTNSLNESLAIRERLHRTRRNLQDGTKKINALEQMSSACLLLFEK